MCSRLSCRSRRLSQREIAGEGEVGGIVQVLMAHIEQERERSKTWGDKKANEAENRDDLTLLAPDGLECESSSRELIVKRKSNSIEMSARIC